MAVADRLPYWIERLPSGNFMCRFPDLPEFTPEAPTIVKLLEDLPDAVIPALEARIKEGQPLPEARPLHAGEEYVTLKPTSSAKLQLITLFQRRNCTPAELARRMGCLPQEANRILKLSHPTKIDTIAAAAAALGAELSCRISAIE